MRFVTIGRIECGGFVSAVPHNFAGIFIKIFARQVVIKHKKRFFLFKRSITAAVNSLEIAVKIKIGFD